MRLDASKDLLASTHGPCRENRPVRSESTTAAGNIVDDVVYARARVIRVCDNYSISLALVISTLVPTEWGRTTATSRQCPQVGLVDQSGICVSAEDGRGREAASVSGDVGGCHGCAGVASGAGVEAEGDSVEALAHFRWSGVDAGGGDEESDGGGELHVEDD
jgi:hypothetical protein